MGWHTGRLDCPALTLCNAEALLYVAIRELRALAQRLHLAYCRTSTSDPTVSVEFLTVLLVCSRREVPAVMLAVWCHVPSCHLSNGSVGIQIPCGRPYGMEPRSTENLPAHGVCQLESLHNRLADHMPTCPFTDNRPVFTRVRSRRWRGPGLLRSHSRRLRGYCWLVTNCNVSMCEVTEVPVWVEAQQIPRASNRLQALGAHRSWGLERTDTL